MHGVGVAHLDLKPTNVVMRKGKEPVLVDFGLAGRHLRLGCGSGPYGAPEVWGLITGDDPSLADPRRCLRGGVSHLRNADHATAVQSGVRDGR